MSNTEHLANVMVEAFIAAVESGVDLVPVVADSTSTAKIAPFIKQFPGRLVNVGIAEQSMVGTAAGSKTVSSFFFMLKDNRVCMFTDCAVIPEPTSAQLADIAISTADVYKRVMGDEARVALLSFSTKGSAKHERVDKVRAALEEIKTREPNLLVDGELQLDAAVEPEVARLKAPGSPVAGNANVFVFPSLEAGNIGYKIAQRFGGWTALGPLLQGFAHGWHDLSRGCSSDDIYKISVVGLGMNRGGQQ